MSAIDACLRANAEYAAKFTMGDLPATPARKIAIVLCMDARIQTSALLGLGEGDAHVIRNAGGVVTDDVIRSLTISQWLLGTREIMLVQHTGCGLLGVEDDALALRIERECGVRPPFAPGGFSDLEASLRASIEELKNCPFLAHRDVIRGFVYEVETGRLKEVAELPT